MCIMAYGFAIDYLFRYISSNFIFAIELLWTPPEDLRSHTPEEYEHLHGSAQSGDVYAAAIILKEVFCRNGPYTENEDLDPKGRIV